MQAWDYKFIALPPTREKIDAIDGERFVDMPQVDTVLRAFGSQGWEVVTHSTMGGYHYFTLKRLSS